VQSKEDLEFWTRLRIRHDVLDIIKIRRARERAHKKATNRQERLQEARALLPPPGSPPFAFRPAFEKAGERPVSRAEIEEAKELFFRRAAIQKANAGGLEGIPYDAVSEYACGIYAFELRAAKRKAFSRSKKSGFNPGGKTAAMEEEEGDGTDHGAAPTIGAWQAGPLPITYTEWRQMGFTTQRHVPLIITEDRKMLERILSQSPGRTRGRPPLDGKAMTSAERGKKHRAKKQEKRK
jgi:hypothetical protein